MSRVAFENVCKYFGTVHAVDEFDLEIEDEEFVVLLGPSGCGKSTALRCIAGLEEITSGTLVIGDRVVNDVEAKDRNVSMVFQSYALYPHMTVRKNVEAPLVARKFIVDGQAARKLTRTERQERMREATDILGLSELLDRKPAALSGGQRQRVALARAIVSRPDVFLFDEPLSNLDAKLRAATRIELVELHRRLQTTFVYVTHDQVEAMTMANRIAIMNDGRLQQVGPPQEVYDRPRNLFVARFIGSPPMNTIACRVRAEDGTARVEIGPEGKLGSLPFTVDGDSPPDDGQPVVAGVRPEHLVIGQDGMTAIVRAVEWLGHERHLICDVGDDAIVVREPTEGRAAAVGDEVTLGAPIEHVHLFDPDSTERLN